MQRLAVVKFYFGMSLQTGRFWYILIIITAERLIGTGRGVFHKQPRLRYVCVLCLSGNKPEIGTVWGQSVVGGKLPGSDTPT